MPDECQEVMQHLSNDPMDDEAEDPARPPSLVVHQPERIPVADWREDTPSNWDFSEERLWGDLIGNHPGAEYILKVSVWDRGMHMEPEAIYCDPTAGVLYASIYGGFSHNALRAYRTLAIRMMEAWREVQTGHTNQIRKIVFPIDISPSAAQEFNSALGSLDNIRPTDQSEWRTLSNRENSSMFTNLMGTDLGQIVTEAATLYRRYFARPIQNRSPAEVKWIQLLLPAKGKVQSNLPIEAVEFGFEEAI